MFGEDGLDLLVGCDSAAGYGGKSLVDRSELFGCGMIEAVTSGLDLEGELRKLVLIVFRPLRDAGQHFFDLGIHDRKPIAQVPSSGNATVGKDTKAVRTTYAHVLS